MVLTSKACMEMLIKRTIKLLVGGRLPGRKFQDHFYAAVKDSLGSIFQVFSVRNFDVFLCNWLKPSGPQAAAVNGAKQRETKP